MDRVATDKFNYITDLETYRTLINLLFQLDRVATDKFNYITDLETSNATLRDEKNILSTVVDGQKQMMDDLHRFVCL